jgi:hypothetical protein
MTYRYVHRQEAVTRGGGKRVIPVVCLVLFAFSIAACVATRHTYREGEHSAYVQARGVRDTGTVLTISTTTDDNGASDTQAVVRLHTPVGGQDVTTANLSNVTNAGEGSTVTVLVDPQDPGYAEFPGKPDVSRTGWIGFAVAALLLDIPGIWYVIWAVRRRRRYPAELRPVS